MKKIVTLTTTLGLICVLFTNPSFAQTQPDEAITNFQSHITINQNTSLTIEETINYQTSEPHHGIYRYIPLTYARDGIRYSTRISRISVTDASGDPYQFTQTRENNNLRLRIGDPDHTFTGKRTYHIKYTVSNALKRFEGHDELYWDITGEGWQIPINTSRATIRSPFASISDIQCYTGPVGSDDKLCNVDPDTQSPTFTYDHTIDYNDNFTVVLALERPNQLQYPSITDQLIRFLIDNWPIFLTPLPFILMFMAWYRFGRDWIFDTSNVFNLDPSQPKHQKGLFEKLNTPFVYEPLSLSPGEAGLILDEKVHNQDVVAEIIDLARKKYLKLEPTEEKGLIFKNTDYIFEKLKPADESLPPQQQHLFRSLFSLGDTVRLSKLKGKLYNEIDETKELLREHLTDRGLFTYNPQSTRVVGFLAAIVLNAIVFMINLPLMTFLQNPLPIILQLPFAMGSLFLAWNLPQKTAIGTSLMLQARGLKETLNLGKWRDEIKEKHLFLEEIIPYSIALGVIGKLAQDMKDLNLKPPDYFTSRQLSGYHFDRLANDFTTSATETLTYNPSSSNWSSGSGFSGGSSGGGGGGGGGGSW